VIGSWVLSRQVEGHLQWSGEWPFPRVRKERSGRILSSGALIGGGVHIEVGPEGVLELGSGVFVNRGCTIICRQRVSIGDRARLAWSVSVMDSDEHQHPLLRAGQTPVTIGGGAWIGAGVIVLKGTNIGDRAVVGAGAVVTRDIPADTLSAGVPARVLRNGSAIVDRGAIPRA
jgi:acetyltransferase-like isoleucine patch superfamily enzyme